MPIRVAINGFGRIGRLVMRAATEARRTDIRSSASTTSARSPPTRIS
jgi:glyceraldehyde-3-phosphate dehydrogenase/erythrose-4-phosphate dehydrogenase